MPTGRVISFPTNSEETYHCENNPVHLIVNTCVRHLCLVFIFISAKWTEWNWRVCCFHFCVSVRTQSINRLCTGRWSPWRHRCMACCDKSILRDKTVIFLYISPKTPLRSWKPIKRRFQQYLFLTNIVNFSHESNTFLGEQYVILPIQSSLQHWVSLPQPTLLIWWPYREMIGDRLHSAGLGFPVFFSAAVR